MAAAFESEQAGKKQSLADIIANAVSADTPYTSMAEKRKKPKQPKHSWQVKTYQQTGHLGVLDGKDASSFDSNPREEISMRAQKTWRLPAVSDFAGETEIAGLGSGGEMAEQIADAIILVKHQIEKRCLSNEDCKIDNGASQGNETRGAFQYINDSAQALYPIPEGYRTPAASIYTSTLALFTEAAFLTMNRSAYKQRRGVKDMHAFLGVDLKAGFTDFSKYSDTVASKTACRDFRQDAKDRTLIVTVDKLALDTGDLDLHLSSYLYTDPTTGADNAQTHRSGIFADMDMVGLAFTRMPRVLRLQNQGGGEKAIVDAIFLHMMDNVLGMMAAKIAS